MPSNSDKIAKCTAERLRLRSEEKYIVDTILPAGSFHLISGPPNIGKTTWMLQTLHDWEHGLPVLGHTSHPCTWAYLATEKSLLATDRRLRSLGLQDWQIEAYSLESVLPRLPSGSIDVSGDLFTRIFTKLKHADLIVLEGVQSFMPKAAKGQSQNQCELLWMASMRDALQRFGMKTIIGTTHDLKFMPAGADNSPMRSRVLGTAGFIGSCETMILIENEVKTDSSCTNRVMHVLGREFPDMTLTYERGSGGRFVPAAIGREPIQTHTDKEIILHTYVTSKRDGFTRKELSEWALQQGDIGPDYAYNLVKQWKASGLLVVESRGRETLYKAIQYARTQ